VALLACIRGAAALLAIAVVTGTVSAQGLEYEVKAAFIYNFVPFVEWPPAALGDSPAPFRMCLYGDDPFGERLARMVRGEQLKDRPIVIERVPVNAAASHCHLLFVPATQAGRVAAAIRAAAGGPVLSIGESPDFIRSGGMINLVVDGGRVRFDVNAAAAAARGLTVSSKLLRIARNASEAEER
jgi:hypothetical protein